VEVVDICQGTIFIGIVKAGACLSNKYVEDSEQVGEDWETFQSEIFISGKS
jgi:hypothetical protein